MRNGLFKDVCMIEDNPNWELAIRRQNDLYRRHDEIRNEFVRDYTRILHSTAYRRLKHKTQVFFATDNDHVCTRIEHVNHVASISDTIVKFLGLNADLTSAIAIGHDLGHAPFGHHGQEELSKIIDKQQLNIRFWHENNGLWFVDKLETLPGPDGLENNLNLTYAVRDGIVCHCGEIDEGALYPRADFIDLYTIGKANEVTPYTWEGCIVKVVDKISFWGRDIEDAFRLKLLTETQIKELKNIIQYEGPGNTIPNTFIIHELITDLCKSSNPTDGIRFSKPVFCMIELLKKFNQSEIYLHPRLEVFKKYAAAVIESIFDFLFGVYSGESTLKSLASYEKIYPLLIEYFSDWIIKYSNIDLKLRMVKGYQNDIVFDISDKQGYAQMIITFISGMTDNFAIAVYNELISFR